MSNGSTVTSGRPASAPRDGGLLSARELAAWRGLLRVHAALSKALDAELVAAHGLQLSSYEVLLTLVGRDEGCMRMSELADSVLLSRSGLTRLVDRLERDGLVCRRACPSDARGQLAGITDRGRELFARARVTHLAGVRKRFLDHLEPADLDELARLWDRVLPGSASREPGCGA